MSRRAFIRHLAEDAHAHPHTRAAPASMLMMIFVIGDRCGLGTPCGLRLGRGIKFTPRESSLRLGVLELGGVAKLAELE